MDDKTRTAGLLAFGAVATLVLVGLTVLALTATAPTATTDHRTEPAYRPPHPPDEPRWATTFTTRRSEEPPPQPIGTEEPEPVTPSVSDALKDAIVAAQQKADDEARVEEERRRSADAATRAKAAELAKTKAEEERRQDALGAKTYLYIGQLRVGAAGRPNRIGGRVLQVLDSKRMLVGICDERANDGRYPTWILLTCPEGAFIEGRLFSGSWFEVLGKKGYLLVTGTVAVKAAGGSKNVLAVEARKRN